MKDDIEEVKFRKGSRFSQLDAAKTFDELEKIRNANAGELSPAAIVAKAKSTRNHLHKAFVWDDTEAARLHREETARSLVRSVIVIRKAAPHVESRSYEITRKAVQEENEPRNVYKTTEDILSDPEAREALLMRAIRDYTSFRERYHALSELALVFKAGDDLLDEFVG